MSLQRLLTSILILCFLFSATLPMSISLAATPLDQVLQSITTISGDNNNTNQLGLLQRILNLLFNSVLGPLLNIGGSKNSTNAPTTTPPVDSTNKYDSGVLRGKTIVLDPGHGGSNPGAVANQTRESDNNLAVGLKLRDLLTKSGAKVIMTRNMDRTVAAEGSTLGQELQSRVDIAEKNYADMFISIHSNSNPISSIAGTMTFFPQGKSDALAQEVQSQIIQQTKSANKGIESATFYVLRNTSMPSILIEMGFVTNPNEAVLLQNDAYRQKIAQGIYSGIVQYFNKN